MRSLLSPRSRSSVTRKFSNAMTSSSVTSSRAGDDFFPVVLGRVPHRRFHQAKGLGAVVGADEEGISVMGQVVFHFVHARQHHREFAVRLRCAER